jgi:hypothetical protein
MLNPDRIKNIETPYIPNLAINDEELIGGESHNVR